MKPPSPGIIKELEDFDLSYTIKVELLMVYAGEKPATEWHTAQTIYYPNRPPDHRGRALFDQVVEWAGRAKLPHEVTEERVNSARFLFSGEEGRRLLEEQAAKKRPVDVEAETARSPEEDRLTLFVAGDRDQLKKLRAAYAARDPQRLGESYGFPPAAVSAYVNGHHVIPPARLRKAPLETKAFAQYMLSRDQPEPDLATAARWAAATSRLSPKIYAEAVEVQAARSRLSTRQLRMMIAATVLLLVPQLGQFLAVHDINTAGHVSDLTLLFQLTSLFFIPTSLILTGAIVWAVRHWWRNHEPLMILAGINTLIAINLILFFINPCFWSQVFGLALKGCH